MCDRLFKQNGLLIDIVRTVTTSQKLLENCSSIEPNYVSFSCQEGPKGHKRSRTKEKAMKLSLKVVIFCGNCQETAKQLNTMVHTATKSKKRKGTKKKGKKNKTKAPPTNNCQESSIEVQGIKFVFQLTTKGVHHYCNQKRVKHNEKCGKRYTLCCVNLYNLLSNRLPQRLFSKLKTVCTRLSQLL